MTGAFSWGVLLAEEAVPPGGQQDAPATARPRDIYGLMIPMVLVFLLFMFFTSRSQKKRDRERAELLNNLKVRDDVVTIGGIKGRIVRITDDEVVVRIDPDKDVKMTMSKTGIARRIGEPQAD
jgi:preprotein translocase subunit YajC